MFVMKNTINAFTRRCYSRKKVIDSNSIRQKFLDYFIKDNNHVFVRSSPVVPFCDPTLSFVNAGMNQFKGVFLGNQSPPAPKVANSQKCIRVGGKHNDLNVVGSDGYHHTFFEMLGNWSFGDYFKQKSCQMAWQLLTQIYEIDPKSLYITYFGGDKNLGLEADYESKEIWNSLGVPENHILPFGYADNFWEMGLSGPCGPCTEIHVDHTNGNNRSSDVNKGLPDLTELWNIVFIQYNRNSEGVISKLPKRHVDTGMGFERLTALLQGKNSNYDTDIFSPLIKSIEKTASCRPYEGKFGQDDPDQIDTGYRILADHSRMISVCLADGMIPEQNLKLRKIIRKAILTGQQMFFKQGFLWGICKEAANILSTAYPEILRNTNRIEQILAYEEYSLTRLRKESSPDWFEIIKNYPDLELIDVAEVPGLMNAFRELKQLEPSLKKHGLIPGEIAFKLYDTYGLDETKMLILSKVFNLSIDLNNFRTVLENRKHQSKQNSIVFDNNEKMISLIEKFKMENVLHTNDIMKYDYDVIENKYLFKDVTATIVKIIVNGEEISETDETQCNILFDKTCLYCEAGGQNKDVGYVLFDNGMSFKINNVMNIQGYIFHSVTLTSQTKGKIKLNDSVTIKLDENNRLGNMRNHTATHLLNSAIKEVMRSSVTCQTSSKVACSDLKLSVSVYGNRLLTDDVDKIEKFVNDTILKKIPVSTEIIDSQKLLSLDNVTLLPGEIYPDLGIRLIKIATETDNKIISCEACCGTHIKNTSHLKSFCITNFTATGRGTYNFKAVTGCDAIKLQKKGIECQESLNTLCKNIENSEDAIDHEQILNKKINLINSQDELIPYVVKMRSLSVLNKLKSHIKTLKRNNLREFVDMEMNSVVEQCRKMKKMWIVHYLQCSCMLESVPLQKATKTCQDLPVIVISLTDGCVKARCCVPKEMITINFNAQTWLKTTVGTVFQGTVAPLRDQDPKFVCIMKPQKVKKNDWEGLLRDALTAANTYALRYLKM